MEVDTKAAPAAAAEPAAPAAVAATPSLADTLASFSAVSPVEGRLLSDQIAAIKANEEKSVAELATLKKQLEEARRRSVDNEVLKQQLKQFQNGIGVDTMSRFGMGNIDDVVGELTSRNGDVVSNTATRMIAACNARFMSMASSGSAEAAPAPKRKRAAEPAPAPAAAAAVAPTPVATADLLRRALAANY